MQILKNIYNYRELLKTNVKKEIRGKYKKSFLGILWSFLNPLLQIAIYAFIFPIILKSTEKNYVAFLCVAIIPWTFFTITVTLSSMCIVTNSNIIKKVYFPREILPISVVTSGAVNFLISTIIMVLFVYFSGIGITKYYLFYPIILIIQYGFLLGIAFIISSITVYFRDIEHFIGIAMQLLFYATPIVYDGKTIPESFQFIMKLNPMAIIINGYRDIFYYQTMPNVKSLAILFGMTVLLCIMGYTIFNKLQKGFAEEL